MKSVNQKQTDKRMALPSPCCDKTLKKNTAGICNFFSTASSSRELVRAGFSPNLGKGLSAFGVSARGR